MTVINNKSYSPNLPEKDTVTVKDERALVVIKMFWSEPGHIVGREAFGVHPKNLKIFVLSFQLVFI